MYHQSRSGFIAVHTSTLIIFGSYSSSMYPAVCVEAVDDKQGQVANLVNYSFNVCMNCLYILATYGEYTVALWGNI